MEIKIRVISSVDKFVKLKPEWERLVSSQEDVNIFLEYDWLFTWWKYFGASHELFILVAYQENRIIGIAPLMKVRRIGFMCLEFIGSALSDFEGVLAALGMEQDICEAMISFLLHERCADIWRIRRLKESNSIFRAFVKIKDKKKHSFLISIHQHKERAPYLNLRDGQENFLKGLKPKFISDTQRRERKLKNEQNFRIVDVHDSAKPILDAMKELHISRRENKNTISFLKNCYAMDFFAEIIEKFHAKGWLSLKALFCREKIAAAHLGFIYKDIYHYYLPVFDDSFRVYAVSRILLNDLIKKSFELRCRMLDFMLGEEPYKFDWNPQLMPLYFCTVTPKTIKGIIAFILFDKINPMLKKWQGKSW